MPFLAGGLLQHWKECNQYNVCTVSMPFLAGGLLQHSFRKTPNYWSPVSMPFLAGGLLQPKRPSHRLRYSPGVSMPFLAGGLLQHQRLKICYTLCFYALSSGRSIATDPFFVPYFISVCVPIFTVDLDLPP